MNEEDSLAWGLLEKTLVRRKSKRWNDDSVLVLDFDVHLEIAGRGERRLTLNAFVWVGNIVNLLNVVILQWYKKFLEHKNSKRCKA